MAAHPDFTLMLAVDYEHLQELKVTWPTWLAFRPEFKECPIVVLCDTAHERGHLHWWLNELSFLDLTRAKCVGINWPNLPQRERMLSSFVLRGPAHVDTKWFLKLDVDVICTGPGSLCEQWWFEDQPAFIASAWRYSKPANTIQRLDDWGDGIAELREFPRLNIPFNPHARLVRHPRIISYAYWGNTEWHRWATGLAGSRLPVPSQDGYCWYVAARTKSFYRRINQKPYGWKHVNGLWRLKEAAAEALSGIEGKVKT